jgi:hypothetical protein
MQLKAARIAGAPLSAPCSGRWPASDFHLQHSDRARLVGAQPQILHCSSEEVDMHDTKERLSLLWIFALFNYLYTDVPALFAYCWLAEFLTMQPHNSHNGLCWVQRS